MIRQFILFILTLVTMTTSTWAKVSSPHRVLKGDYLSVCTTGDYPPLTDRVHGVYRGQAIDNAKRLARYLGVKVRFVKTTWVTLEKDLARGRCDIAMGGISLTQSRKKHFLVTLPVLTFGKVPLTRCTDRRRYQTLKQINQPRVRVVVNKGGTNQQFAKRYLSQAKLIIVPQNAMTFQYLLLHKADVFVTDSIEAVYRQRLNPALCAIHPNQPFTHGEKVYLLPKHNKALLKAVNAWIKKDLQ